MNRRLLYGIPLLALLAFLAVAMSGDAAVEGPCTGTINGDEFHGTVTVPENGTVAWQFTSTAGNIKAWDIEMLFAGATIPVDSGEDEEPDQTTKGGVANVNDYAKYGVGIYELTGAVVTEGGTCSGSVKIIVQGNPLTTAVGGAAAAAAVIGTGGAAAAGGLAAKGALAGLKP